MLGTGYLKWHPRGSPAMALRDKLHGATAQTSSLGQDVVV